MRALLVYLKFNVEYDAHLFWPKINAKAFILAKKIRILIQSNCMFLPFFGKDNFLEFFNLNF
jgi:hypothetical protein